MQTNKCTVVKPNLILISTAPLHVLYVSKPMARVEEDNCYLEFPGVVSKPGTWSVQVFLVRATLNSDYKETT